jgi:hypothetical protein
MDRKQYREARRIIRDNGMIAYRWLAAEHGSLNMEALRDLENAQDWLAERADIVDSCNRKGISYTFGHLANHKQDHA